MPNPFDVLPYDEDVALTVAHLLRKRNVKPKTDRKIISAHLKKWTEEQKAIEEARAKLHGLISRSGDRLRKGVKGAFDKKDIHDIIVKIF